MSHYDIESSDSDHKNKSSSEDFEDDENLQRKAIPEIENQEEYETEPEEEEEEEIINTDDDNEEPEFNLLEKPMNEETKNMYKIKFKDQIINWDAIKTYGDLSVYCPEVLDDIETEDVKIETEMKNMFMNDIRSSSDEMQDNGVDEKLNINLDSDLKIKKKKRGPGRRKGIKKSIFSQYPHSGSESSSSSSSKSSQSNNSDDNNKKQRLNNNNNKKKSLNKLTSIKKTLDQFSNEALIKALGDHMKLIKNIHIPNYTTSNQVWDSWELYVYCRNVLRKVFNNLYYTMTETRGQYLFITEKDYCWNIGKKFNPRDYYLNMTRLQRLKWVNNQLTIWYNSKIKSNQGYKTDYESELNTTWINQQEWDKYVNDNYYPNYIPKGTYVMFSRYKLIKSHLLSIGGTFEEQLKQRKDMKIEKIIFIRTGPVLYIPFKGFNDGFQLLLNAYIEELKTSFEILSWELFFIKILKCKNVPQYKAITFKELPQHLKKKILLERQQLSQKRINNEMLLTDEGTTSLSRIRVLPIDDVITQLYGWKSGQLVQARSFIISITQTIDYLRVVNLTIEQIMKSNIEEKVEEPDGGGGGAAPLPTPSIN